MLQCHIGGFVKIQVIFLSLFLLSLFNCAGVQKNENASAEELYKEAQKLVVDEHYIAATERLNNIKSKYPYSYYATHAELLQADILFKQKNFVEATAAYILFKDFHPKHKKMSYVVFKVAESYYNQMPSTYERDISSGLEAIKYYSEVLQRYVRSPYAKQSIKKIKECKKMIENKEKYIADFYFKTKSFEAARYRFLSIINTFNDSDLRKYSMLKVLESSRLLNDRKQCVKYFNEFKNKVDTKTRAQLEKSLNSCKNFKKSDS